MKKISIWCSAVALALAGALTISNATLAQSASAPLIICNKTSDQLGLAIGYYSAGVNDTPDHNVLTGPFVSHGWWTVDPGQCQTTENPFNARYIFWYGISKGYNDDASVVQASETAAAAHHFCVPWYFGSDGGSVRAFTLEDENASIDACHAGGTRLWVVSHKADTAVDATVNFTGSDTQ